MYAYRDKEYIAGTVLFRMPEIMIDPDEKRF
jgi:hypothetical protein